MKTRASNQNERYERKNLTTEKKFKAQVEEQITELKSQYEKRGRLWKKWSNIKKLKNKLKSRRIF